MEKNIIFSKEIERKNKIAKVLQSLDMKRYREKTVFYPFVLFDKKGYKKGIYIQKLFRHLGECNSGLFFELKNYKPRPEGKLPFLLGYNKENKAPLWIYLEDGRMLVGGSSKSGKSRCLFTGLLSILYFTNPEYCKIVLMDCQGNFDDFKEIATICNSSTRIKETIEKIYEEMKRRIRKKQELGIPAIFNSHEINKLAFRARKKEALMPYIVILFDEVESFIEGNDKKDETVKRIMHQLDVLMKQGRKYGIYFVFSTQSPYANMMEGSIKNNLNFRICFQTSSKAHESIIINNTEEKELSATTIDYREFIYPNKGVRTLNKTYDCSNRTILKAIKNLKRKGYDYRF